MRERGGEGGEVGFVVLGGGGVEESAGRCGGEMHGDTGGGGGAGGVGPVAEEGCEGGERGRGAEQSDDLGVGELR